MRERSLLHDCKANLHLDNELKDLTKDLILHWTAEYLRAPDTTLP